MFLSDSSPIHPIEQALYGGIPAALIIPVQPADKNNKNSGKTPVRYAIGSGFYPLKDWPEGITFDDLMQANKHGANAGLLLGKSYENKQYVALDIDIERGITDQDELKSIKICNYIINEASNFFKQPIYFRRTWPFRGAIIFELPALENPGKKTVADVFQKIKNKETMEETKIRKLKLEILTKGQQIVIAGKHYSGNTITWHRSDDLECKFPYLPSDIYLPRVPNIDTVITFFELVLSNMEKIPGLEIQKKSSGGRVIHNVCLHPDFLPVPSSLPPTLKDFLALIKVLPHDEQVTREGKYSYPSIMLAMVGCIRGLGQYKKISREEQFKADQAAIEWASKWETPDGRHTTFHEEYDKYYSDWNQKESVVLGWDYLESFGLERGVYSQDDIYASRINQAKQEFDFALHSKNSYTTDSDGNVIPNTEETENDPSARRKLTIYKDSMGQVMLEAPRSDFQITEEVADILQGRAYYLEDEKRWIAWDGKKVGWSTPYAKGFICEEIFDLIRHYTQVRAHILNDAQKTKILSSGQVDAVEKLLKAKLRKTSDHINKSATFLQTPQGMFDLKTLNIIPVEDQIPMIDTRLTSVIPAQGDTPLFDNLILTLSNNRVEIRDWIINYLGYTIIGAPTEHIFLLIEGSGGNGKSLLMDIIREILGSYSVMLDRNVILDCGKSDHKTAVAQIKGKRFWYIDELPPREKYNESQLRALTGSSTINARKMQQDMSEIQIEGVMTITTNFTPKFYRIDDAIVRRMRLLHTGGKPVGEPDKHLKTKILTQEGPAILYKLMAEARKVLDNGLMPVPDYMVAMCNRYFRENDAIFMWMMEYCDLGSEYKAFTKDLFASFKAYIEEDTDDAKKEEGENEFLSNEKSNLHIPEPMLVGYLKGRGITITKNSIQEVCSGIRLKLGKSAIKEKKV